MGRCWKNQISSDVIRTGTHRSLGLPWHRGAWDRCRDPKGFGCFPVSDGTNEKWHLKHEEIGIYGALTIQNWDLAPGADGSGTLQPILVGFQRGQGVSLRCVAFMKENGRCFDQRDDQIWKLHPAWASWAIDRALRRLGPSIARRWTCGPQACLEGLQPGKVKNHNWLVVSNIFYFP